VQDALIPDSTWMYADPGSGSCSPKTNPPHGGFAIFSVMNIPAERGEVPGRWLARAAAPLFAALSIALALLNGKDLNWDLLNYHFYNGWAFVAGRMSVDVAPAQLQSYFNPLLDIPLYFAIRSLAAWQVAVIYATAQSFNAELVRRIALHLLPPIRQRELAAFGLGLLVLGGAIYRGEAGGSMGDTLVSIPVLASVCLLVAQRDAVAGASTRIAAPLLLLSGFCAGAAAGFKLVMLIYALGFGIATMLLDTRPLLHRWRFPLLFGLGALGGWLLLDGWWLLHLWRQFGNPLFPFFNSYFHAPLAPTESLSDTRFLPRSFTQALMYPLAWTWHPRLVSDVGRFFDLRIPLLFVLGTGWLAVALVRSHRPTTNAAVRFILLGCALSYLLWLLAFGILRYLAVLEFLAPLCCVALIFELAAYRRRNIIAVFAVAFLLIVAVRPLREAHGAWRGDYFAVEVPEVVSGDTQSLVLMGGFAPIAFVVPQLSPSHRFLRVQGNFTGRAQEHGMDRQMHDTVAAHRGALVALASAEEMTGMDPVLVRYGLRRTTALQDCAVLDSAAQTTRPAPMLNGPLLWCALERINSVGAAEAP
jgi:hypothetical protein